jgi:primosomal replication protein N
VDAFPRHIARVVSDPGSAFGVSIHPTQIVESEIERLQRTLAEQQQALGRELTIEELEWEYTVLLSEIISQGPWEKIERTAPLIRKEGWLEGQRQAIREIAERNQRKRRFVMSVNRVQLLGRLGHDPELEHLGGKETAHVLLSIYTDRRQGDEVVSQRIPVHVWGRQAENCNAYLTKGRQVYAEGHLRLNTWEDNGEPRSRLEVVATRVVFLGGRGKEAVEIVEEE